MINTTRRGFLLGVGAALAAPAIVRFESLMPVRNRLIYPGTGEWIAYTMSDECWAEMVKRGLDKDGTERTLAWIRTDTSPWALRYSDATRAA